MDIQNGASYPINGSVEDSTEENKEFVVKIQNPQTIREQGKAKYIRFQIYIENSEELPLENCSHVRRTYLDFAWFRGILRKRHGHSIVPPLYKKFNLGYKTDFYHIVKQQKSMNDFTEACFQVEELFMDPLFWLFFQSDLTVEEIGEVASGKTDGEYLVGIWEKNGITKTPEIDYWDMVTSDEYYDTVICKQNTEQTR